MIYTVHMIDKNTLKNFYENEGRSMQDIADQLGCSLHKVQYWMKKHGFAMRSISDAIYLKHNPDGDPFRFRRPRTQKDALLFGMGIGIYWGEGTKANRHAVRLGNTDPQLLCTFMDFIIKFFNVKKKDFRAGLQIFTDINPKEALAFWQKNLRIGPNQFYKVTITRSGSIGTYRKKSRYGVVTIYYNNKKMRDILMSLLPS